MLLWWCQINSLEVEGVTSPHWCCLLHYLVSVISWSLYLLMHASGYFLLCSPWYLDLNLVKENFVCSQEQ